MAIHQIYTPAGLLLLTVLAIATVTDHRQRIIPNWLSYSAILAAFALSLITSVTASSLGSLLPFRFTGALPLSAAVLGGGVCGGIMLALYLALGVGAGDVKLLTAVGLILGTREGLMVLVLGQAIAALIVVSLAVWSGGISDLIHVFSRTSSLADGEVASESSADGDTERASLGVPMAGAFAVAALLVVWSEGWPA